MGRFTNACSPSHAPVAQTNGGRVLLGVPGGVPLRLGVTAALDAVCVAAKGEWE